MSSRPFTIRISSQKGGVGKTTVSVNLAAALSAIGMRVLLIDFDFINPSLGFHLGLQNSNSGVRSVLMGKSALKSNAVVIHAATGMHVLPGEMHAQTHTPTKEQLATLFGQIEKSGYDIVIVDTPPGFLPEENLKAFGEALIITTPETSATISAARLANHYDKIGLEHILVVNKFKNKRYELHAREMEEVYRGKISATLPDDETIPISVAEHVPAYTTNPHAPFSRAIKSLADRYAVKLGFAGKNSPKQEGVLSKIIFAIRKILQGR